MRNCLACKELRIQLNLYKLTLTLTLKTPVEMHLKMPVSDIASYICENY